MSDSEESSSSESEVEMVKKKGKKRSASTSEKETASEEGAKPAAKKKKIEEQYRKMSPREHVLARPDMYVGSTKKQEQEEWIFQGDGMVWKNIEFVPGLYKIFDEIIVNAADNYQRDKSQTTIKVNINQEDNLISVYNDGRAIPIEIHDDYKIYVPELIFGVLLTGENFDDDEQKVTGGRNGLGAKLANIYSTEFIVETASNGKKYRQVFSQNMTDKSEPKITNISSKKESWTKISFKPDLARFGMTQLEDDMLCLMKKRVYDIAGCNSELQVYYNDARIKMKNFSEYAKMYLKNNQKALEAVVHETIIEDKTGLKRWEVAITVSDGDPQQVSFVNGICTLRGGTHVNHVLDAVVKHLKPIVEKKNKGAELKPSFIKNNIWLFVNSLINNPEFDSQTKETLRSKVTNFGTRCTLSDSFLGKVAKSGLVEQILTYTQMKGGMELGKMGGTKKKRLTGLAKLVDANNAGSRLSTGCTLILTEGDSAKALAIAGMSVIGRDNFGVFPLKGKFINVREAKHKSIMKNEEIKSLLQIMGLDTSKQYEDVKSLRYGHVMIMTDQDHDGSHIKGLLINFIHYFWPSLLKQPFLTEFITPIVKVTKGKQTISFYTIPEYENWRESVDTKGWTNKYYKGLGTSTPEEAIEYFEAIGKHKKEFKYSGDDDDKAINIAFGKKAKASANSRKEWINKYEAGTYLDQSKKIIPYNDFINKELILYSIASNMRAIPSICDGLKPGQRKILFVCFKRNLKKEVKVAQLSGSVAEKAAYHHGEVNLHSTIVNMAQNFVGSNNINLLHPQGQFGTRLEGGKDAASARYIHTFLAPLARATFPAADDPILTYLEEDSVSIEPEWYIPVIPLLLANGAEGIGTGWSCSIPNHNPRDLVDNIRLMLKGEEPVAMHPWYRGFMGEHIWNSEKDSYEVHGVWNRVDSDTIEVTELPVGYWTQTFKEFLEDEIVKVTNPKAAAKAAKGKGKAKANDKKKEEPGFVADYKDYSTHTKVHFVITVVPELAKKDDDEFANHVNSKFGLMSWFKTSNMHLFDRNGKIKKYTSAVAILKEFYAIRYEYYNKRKEHIKKEITNDLKKLQNQVRFIEEVIAEKLIVKGRKKGDVMKDLIAGKYDRFPPKTSKLKNVTEEALEAAAEEEEEPEELTETDRDYDYLLSMKIWSLTAERVKALKQKLAAKQTELEEIEKKTPEILWETDLKVFEDAWDTFEKAMGDFDAGKGKQPPKIALSKSGRGRGARGRGGKAAVKKEEAKEKDSDDEEASEAPAAGRGRGRGRGRGATTRGRGRGRGAASAASTSPKRGTKRKEPEAKVDTTGLLSDDDDSDAVTISPAKKIKTETGAKAKPAEPPKETKTTTTRGRKPKAKDDDEEEEGSPLKQSKLDAFLAGKKTSAAAKKQTPKDSDDDDDDELPLSARLKKQNAKTSDKSEKTEKSEMTEKSEKTEMSEKTEQTEVSQTEKSEAPPKKANLSKKALMLDDSDDDNDDDDDDKSKTSKGNGKFTVSTTSKASATSKSQSDDDDDEDESKSQVKGKTTAAKGKTAAAKKTTTRAAAKRKSPSPKGKTAAGRKKKPTIDTSEEEDAPSEMSDEDDDDEDESKSTTTRGGKKGATTTTRRGAAPARKTKRKPVKYNDAKSDSSSEESEDSDIYNGDDD